MRVLVAMDRELVRYGLIQLLKDVTPITYMATASTVEELINTFQSYEFDLIVIDSQLAGVGKIESLFPFLKELPSSCKRVFMCEKGSISWNEIDTYTFHGIFSEQAHLTDLMDFFQKILRGERIYLNVEKGFVQSNKQHENITVQLAKREQQVFQLKVYGYTVRDTAKLLNISPKTVENHRRNIRRKLNINKNSEWMEWGRKFGVI